MNTPTNDVTNPATTASPDDSLNEQGKPVETPEREQTGSASRHNAEAARRRVELREAQAERDALRARVADLQQREVERLAGAQLAKAGDLLTYGDVSLDDLLNDEGNVDAEAVKVAVAGLLADRPGLRAVSHPGGGVPSHGLGYRRSVPSVGASWAEALRG